MKFLRTVAFAIIAVAASIMTVASRPALAQDVYKVAIHVSENDPKIMNLALNNVENMLAAYKKAGKKVQIEVVTYGPGLTMFREDKSPVKARVQSIGLAHPNVAFSACSVTHSKAEAAEKKKIPIVSEAKMVPSGVLRLVELQRQGWAYIKP
ncbi:MAG: DsrE family protein [Hyphomicrobiaceae bacterium]